MKIKKKLKKYLLIFNNICYLIQKSSSKDFNKIEFEKEIWDLERIDSIQQNDGERVCSFSLSEDFELILSNVLKVLVQLK